MINPTLLLCISFMGVAVFLFYRVAYWQERREDHLHPGKRYSFGLRRKQISTLTCIISVDNVVASILACGGGNERLSYQMCLKHQKSDPKLLAFLYTGFGKLSIEADVGVMVARLHLPKEK